MQKRVHSREFKLDVVRQVIIGQKHPVQICREYSLTESVLSRWKKEYQERGEAAFQPAQAEGLTTQEQRMTELEQFCGQLALENQILKKNVATAGVAERHTMITLAHQDHPEITIEHLCELLEVSRSWYYEHSSQLDPDPQDVALRDEIERIILEFAG